MHSVHGSREAEVPETSSWQSPLFSYLTTCAQEACLGPGGKGRGGGGCGLMDGHRYRCLAHERQDIHSPINIVHSQHSRVLQGPCKWIAPTAKQRHSCLHDRVDSERLEALIQMLICCAQSALALSLVIPEIAVCVSLVCLHRGAKTPF